MKGISSAASLGVLLLLLCSVADGGGVNGTEEGEEEVQSFEEVEKNLKASVGNLVKRILPYLLEGGGDADVSGPCKSSIMKIIGGVRQLREWAMRFVDATGKIPPGILEGTSFSVGDYDECLDIKVPKRDSVPMTPDEIIFQGQYCLLEAHRPEGINRAIKEYQEGNKDTAIAKTKTFLNMFIRYKHLTNSTFKMGVCVPSKCSKQDLENILASESLKNLGKITVFYCKQNEEEETSSEMMLLMCLFGFIVGILVVGTIIDTVLRLLKKDKTKEKSPYNKCLEQISRHVSLYTNALEVLRTSTQENLKVLCGLRPIIVILIIYSHTYGHFHSLHFQKFSKAANFLRFFDSFTFSGIANGSVAVDSIVVIAGMTITYSRWRFISEKSKVSLSIWKLLLQRYFRMSAAQLLTICMFLMLPLVGSGPFWIPYTEAQFNNCRDKWWMNILYVNNFLKTETTCLYHTWILCVIMQFSIIAAFVIWILKKSFRFGIFMMVVLILACIIGVGIVTVMNKLPGSMAFFMLDIRTAPIAWRDVYILPYDHLGPFCIGLMSGYFLAVKKDSLNISRTTNVILWCCSTVCACSVLFGLYGYRKGEEMEQSLSAFYAVMHRNVWAACIAWMIVACTTKHGGAVARVLMSKFFVPLDRLCFLAYLLHIPIMFYHSGILRERFFMGHIDLLFQALGYIILSFVASFFLNIIFVKPYYAIEDYIASSCRTKKKVCFDSDIIPVGQVQTGEMSAITEVPVTGCVNVAYSKKLDGL